MPRPLNVAPCLDDPFFWLGSKQKIGNPNKGSTFKDPGISYLDSGTSLFSLSLKTKLAPSGFQLHLPRKGA